MPSTCYKFSLPLTPKEGDKNTHVQVEVDHYKNRHAVMLAYRLVEIKDGMVSFMFFGPTLHLTLDTMNRLNRKKVEQNYLQVKREIEAKEGMVWAELTRFLTDQNRELEKK